MERKTIDISAKSPEDLVTAVRERYGRIAAESSSCCGSPRSCCAEGSESVQLGYRAVELGLVPEGADLGLGCGAPVGHLGLKAGETVLDLGSGAGIDVFLAARAVGPSGFALGVDMTPEMLATARRNAAKAGVTNVEFREGRLEALPVDDATVDAITSNCVINLVPDKAAVFREVARVLRPGGRLVVSDIVLDGELPAAIRSDILSYVGCVSGATARVEYFRMLAEAGLGEVEILKDVDFLAMIGDSVPAELAAFLERTGVTVGELRGVVRSVTYRAWKTKG